jgi:hypothetical protein
MAAPTKPKFLITFVATAEAGTKISSRSIKQAAEGARFDLHVDGVSVAIKSVVPLEKSAGKTAEKPARKAAAKKTTSKRGGKSAK